MDKRVKISDMLTKIEASPMQKMIKEMRPYSMLFDNPTLNMVREMQEKISTLTSPMSILSKNLMDSPALKRATAMQDLVSSVISPMQAITKQLMGSSSAALMLAYEKQQNISALLGNSASFANLLQKNYPLEAINMALQSTTFSASFNKISAINLDLLKTLDLSNYDFSLNDDEDISIEDYQLDVIPDDQREKKIILLHEVSRLQSTIEEVYKDNSKLYTLKPRDFEAIIGELLKHKNFEVELTKQTRDGGYDLIAVQNLAGFPLRFLVECKRYAPNKPVGIEIIRAFSHVIQTTNANKGILFTTSYFSKDARQHAQNYMPYQLDFREKGDILEWIKTYLTLS